MADTPKDSPVVPTDAQGVPLPEISGASAGERGSGGAQPAFDTEAVKKLVADAVQTAREQILQELEPSIGQRVQSIHDRRMKPLEKLAQLDPEDIKIVADTVKAVGGDASKAAMELGLQALLQERRSGSNRDAAQASPSLPQDPGRSKAEMEARVEKVLSSLKLSDADRKAVLDEWKTGSYPSFDDALVGLNTIALKANPAVNPPQPPSAAGVVTPGASVPGVVNSEEKMAALDRLYGELNDLIPHASKNSARIAEIKKTLREMGEKDI